MTTQTALGFRAFDVDEHYYEAPDAFIRHIDPSMKKRCMQWAEIDGRKRFMVAGKVNKFIPNPTFDPIAKPGSLEDYFRGRNLEGTRHRGHVRGARPSRRPPGLPGTGRPGWS